MRRALIAFGALAGLCAVATIGELSPNYAPLVWQKQTVSPALPPSISLYAGVSAYEDGRPLRAWYLDIDYNDLDLRARPVLSQSPTGRETASSMARANGALVAINGGYFDMSGVPARTFSLVENDGKVLVPNIARITRRNPGRKYDVSRSAFGIRANRTFDVAWIRHIDNAIYSYPTPIPNTMTTPAAVPLDATGGQLWDANDAIGAGPTLISDGQIVDTYEAEVFFDSGFSSVAPYPRAAIGYTANRHLIMFATDGKQTEHSVGLSLAALALEMKRLGCVEAMNLDGGGSETLVVNGVAVNHPSDGQERAVTSSLVISSKSNPNPVYPVAPLPSPVAPAVPAAPIPVAPVANAPLPATR